jgi:TPR repeat protein
MLESVIRVRRALRSLEDGVMGITKTIIGLTLSLLLGSGVAIAADFNKGIQAYNSGDFKAALDEWIPLAEQGDVYTQNFLGFALSNAPDAIKDIKSAVKWYTKAAEQGHAGAQYSLGIRYATGEGVPENDKTAVKWFTLAAEQGHAKAQGNLGVMYDHGQGALTDTKRAYMWFNLGSYNGDKRAGENKGILAKDMTPADISKAQDMSSRCLESNYTDC